RTQVVHRTVTIAEEETYVITGRVGPAVAFEANSPSMIVSACVSLCDERI
ncbi:subtilisin-like protease, partial [Trifolium medium]|nr:subtilisin-like protease [Trifolium medium]